MILLVEEKTCNGERGNDFILFYFMQWKIKKKHSKAIKFLKQKIVKHMMGYLNAKSVFFEFQKAQRKSYGCLMGDVKWEF